MPDPTLTATPTPPGVGWSVENLLSPKDLAELTRRAGKRSGFWDPQQTTLLLEWLVETHRGEQVLIELTRIALTNKLQIHPR